jgi:hypothetical protein
MKLLMFFFLSFFFSQIIRAEDKSPQSNKIEELRQHHLKIMDERLAHLEIRHKKKIEFENELYNLEKNHLQEISKLESQITANDKNANQKLIIEIKQKMKAFQETMNKKNQSFHQSMKQEIEDFKKSTREKVKSFQQKK